MPGLVTALLDNDRAVAINYFDTALSLEGLHYLEARHHFEALCMEVAVTWPQLNPPADIPADQAYPIMLVEHMAEAFGWDNGEAGSDYVQQALPMCIARLDSANHWRHYWRLPAK